VGTEQMYTAWSKVVSNDRFVGVLVVVKSETNLHAINCGCRYGKAGCCGSMESAATLREMWKSTDFKES